MAKKLKGFDHWGWMVAIAVLILSICLVIGSDMTNALGSLPRFNYTSRCTYTTPQAQTWQCGINATGTASCFQGQGTCIPFLCNTTTPPACNSIQNSDIRQNSTTYIMVN